MSKIVSVREVVLKVQNFNYLVGVREVHLQIQIILFVGCRCKLDSTLNYSYSISSKQRFSIQAFRFIEDHPVVHLHCEVLACHRNTARSRCLQGCSRYRGRRSDREAYGSESTKAYDMSSGPINFKKESSGTETKEGELAPFIDLLD